MGNWSARSLVESRSAITIELHPIEIARKKERRGSPAALRGARHGIFNGGNHLGLLRERAIIVRESVEPFSVNVWIGDLQRHHLRSRCTQRHAAFENAEFGTLEVLAGKLWQNGGVLAARRAPILCVEENTRMGEALVERNVRNLRRRTAAQEIEFYRGFAGLFAQSEMRVKMIW